MSGVDVLFVNLPPHESYYADGVPHLGMLYVLTSLRHYGYSTSYLDCAGRSARRETVLDAIAGESPRLVGFSVDTDSIYNIPAFTRSLRARLGPGVPIILGGPASQSQAEEMLSRGAADVVVIGEGEYTTREVADFFLRGQGSLEAVSGICYRAADGSLRRTADRPPIEDLDALPFPDRAFLPQGRRYEASIITGRGCPFRCTFCFEGRMGNKYRHRSAENIVAEIGALVEKYKRPFVMINDDTFTADIPHTREFCRLLRSRFKAWRDLLMFCEVRADVLHRDPDLIDELVDCGVARIQVGVESASRTMLKSYKRLNVRPEVVEAVLSRFHKAGIPSIYCGFIVGGPGETRETFAETTAFARRMIKDVAPGSFECNASFLTPLPGTELFERPREYGLRLLDPELITSSNFNYCVAETETLSQEDITNMRTEFLQQIDTDMSEVLFTLPRNVVARHMTLKNEYGVGTRYAQMVTRIEAWNEYWSVVGGEGGLDPSTSMSDETLLGRYPVRIGTPAQVRGNCAAISQTYRTVHLNAVATEIYRRASGKLTVGEIVDDLAVSLNGTAPPLETLRADVIATIRSLDEQCAIYLKDY